MFVENSDLQVCLTEVYVFLCFFDKHWVYEGILCVLVRGNTVYPPPPVLPKVDAVVVNGCRSAEFTCSCACETPLQAWFQGLLLCHGAAQRVGDCSQYQVGVRRQFQTGLG